MRTTPKDSSCLLVTRDPSLVDAVSATALALGVPLEVAGDREGIRALWAAAGLRLVGADMAAGVAVLAASRTHTWVVGQADSALIVASTELGVPALALPQSSPELAEVMSLRGTPEPQARQVAFVGGSGGVGASSLSAAVSLLAAHRGQRVATVELADCGGGLDLLFGLETAAGVRWNDLAAASGELGGLDELLVRGDGVSVLALDREGSATPTKGAIDAVLRSLTRSHELVVLDAGDGQHLQWAGEGHVVVVVAAHVRGVAAARMLLERHDSAGAQVLVRTGPGAQLPAGAVAAALGLPVLGVVRHDPAVARLASSGASIMSGPARRFRRDVRGLVDGLLG